VVYGRKKIDREDAMPRILLENQDVSGLTVHNRIVIEHVSAQDGRVPAVDVRGDCDEDTSRQAVNPAIEVGEF
jgi:hypothetical protein